MEDAVAATAIVSVSASLVGLLVEDGRGSVDRGGVEGSVDFSSETGGDNCGWQATIKLRTAIAAGNLMIQAMKLFTPGDRLMLTRWSVSKAMHLVHGREHTPSGVC